MLRLLPPPTRSQLRSSIAICSLCQCVDELVLNSLDAGATCVAVRVDLSRFWIQVVDNGDGITENNLEKIGTRYMTSKCQSLDDLQNLCHYGYRGEALASIRDISKNLEIQTRGKSSSNTFSVEFTGSKPGVVSKYPYSRPSSGTTVTVDDLFHSLPVRKKCFGEYLELERIRERLEAFSLIHPNVSISLRNDAAGCVILQSRKSSSILGAFAHIFGGKLAKSLVEICNEDGDTKVLGYFGKEGHTNKNVQFVFVNGRLILKSKIHKTLNVLLSKSLIVQKNSRGREQAVPALLSPTNLGSPCNERELYPVFVVRIDCPLTGYDITFDPAKTLVEFRDWNALLGQLQGLVGDFLRRENLLMRIEKEVSEKCTGCLSSNEVRKDIAVEEQVTAPGPAGYGEGINSYDRSYCLASSTARRAVPAEQDAVSDGATDDRVAGNGLLEGTCLSSLQQKGCDMTDNGCKIGMTMEDKPLGDETSVQCDVTSEVKRVKDNLGHCYEICDDEDTLPTPKRQSEAERKDCRKEANTREETSAIKNYEMISKGEDGPVIVLDSPEVVTSVGCDIIVGKSKGELDRHCLKSGASSVCPVKEATENCLKRKKSDKMYVDISSTDSERTPDYSVDLPDICGRKRRRSSLRSQRRSSYPSSLVSVKTSSVGRKDSKWKRPHSKRKIVKSSPKKISAQGDMGERTSKRKCVDSSQKRILVSEQEHSKVGIPKSNQKVARKTADEKHVSYGYAHDQDETARCSLVSKKLGVTCLESPSTLFHQKRTRTSSKRTPSTSVKQKAKGCCGLDNPDDSLTVSSTSRKSKRFKSCAVEQKDIAKDRSASTESGPYEDENPLEPIRSNDIPGEIPAEVSTNDHSSLWKFRQEKQRLGTLALSQSGGSQGCDQTVRTSSLWRRIRKMYKKTPALLKCHGYDGDRMYIDHICNSYVDNQESTNVMLLAPMKQEAKKTGVMEAFPKESLPDVICLEADDPGLSERKECNIPERRDLRRNAKGRKDPIDARSDDVQDKSGLNIAFNNDMDTGKSRRTSELTRVQPPALSRISEQGQFDCFSGSKFVHGTELSASGFPQANYRRPVFRESFSRPDHLNEYHYKSRHNADFGGCLADQCHRQFDNPADSTTRYRGIETGFQHDVRKKSEEKYRKKWHREFEIDDLSIDPMDIRRTHPNNVFSDTVHYSVGDADGLCPPFPDDCRPLVDVKATDRVTKRMPKSRLVRSEVKEDVLHQRRQLERPDNYQKIKETTNLYQNLIEQSLDQSSSFKPVDSRCEVQEPKNLYQDLIGQTSRAGHHKKDYFSITSKTVDSADDGKTALPDGSCSPYFCPLQRTSSKDMLSYCTDRDSGIGRSAMGFRDSLALLGTKERSAKVFYAGTKHQSRPNLANDDCCEGGFENGGKSQHVTSSSVNHNDRFWKNVDESVHGSFLPGKQIPIERISGPADATSPEKSCQIYAVIDGEGGISNARNESDLIDLGWLPRKEKRNSRQRANDEESTRSRQSLVGPVESIALIPETKKTSGYGKRLDDPRTIAVKDSVQGQASSNPDGLFSSSEQDVRNVQGFRELFSVDSGDLEPWELRQNSADRLVGPRNSLVQSQDFDPKLPPSGGTSDFDKFPCTQAFEITISDEQIRGASSQDIGSHARGFAEGLDSTLPERQKSTKYVAVGQQSDNSSKDVDSEFCVFTPSITDIKNSKNKKELSTTFPADNVMPQPRGKKLLLQRYNEEMEKTSKVEKNNEKHPEGASEMTSSIHLNSWEVENAGVKSMEKDNVMSVFDSNFSFPSWHQSDISHTESVGGKALGAQSVSVVDAALNVGGGLGDETGQRQAYDLDYGETERTKTPESQRLVSECLSDILQDSGSRSQMSDIILKKHTPEWLKGSQDMLTQSVIVNSSAYDLEAPSSILPQKCIDVTTRDQSVDVTTQGQNCEILRTCFDGSDDLFSTWPSLPSGQDVSSQGLNKARETVSNDNDINSQNSCSLDKEILPSSVSVVMPEGSLYEQDSNGSEFRMAKDLLPGKALPKGNQDGCGRGSDSGLGIDAAAVNDLMETSGGCCAYTCMIDPKSGRTMYIHLATGNTTYEKPTFTDRPPEAHEKDKKKGGFTQHRYLSHGASPVMPRPKEDRKVSLSTTPSEKMSKLLEGHKEKQDADRDVKWRQTGGEDGGCPSGQVEKMFAEWDNPVFKEPPQEAMSIEMAGERRDATKVYNSLQSFKFTKEVFHGIKVIEQVDRKFIACLMSMGEKKCLSVSDPQLLVFVDQHAAHERIRLEKSIMDLYDSEENMKSVSKIPAMKLMVGTQQVRAMAAQERSFKKIGINFIVEKASRDTILVERFPKCLCKQGKEVGEKHQAARCSPDLEEAVMDLLREHAETLQRSSGAAGTIPKPILKLLWSQACHGAIKFGDSLTHAECEDLITSLSACNLPFQCAHGRPSMVPIIDLSELDKRLNVEKQKPNLQRLRKLVETDPAVGQQVSSKS